MFSKKLLIGLIFLGLVGSGCNKYQKLLKSGDNEAKYAAAMDLYEDQDYYRALQLFQQLLTFYQGTEQGQKMQFYYAYCYYYERDYILASYYFKRFSSTYPRSEMAEEALFMSAYCYFLDSPRSSLDQTNTITAINELQLFMEMFPYSERVEKSQGLIAELQLKLEKKDIDVADLYYKMEDYEAAITSYKNILKDYPDTEKKEDILFRVFKSYYFFATKSITAKQAERYQSALDSYNDLVYTFPETQYLREAKNIQQSILKRLGTVDVSQNN
jgi:outer membrane protein assembly factor BamD